MKPVAVNIDRLSRELTALAAFSDVPSPAVTRVLYTEPDLKARAYLKRLATDAGLSVREDAIGNTFLRWIGSEPSFPAIGTGSHTDAIPHSGMYDGTVGVLGGLEAIRSLKESGFQPKRSLEVLMFTSEEPTRFRLGCVGSRALSGAISIKKLAELKDSDGQRFDDVRQAVGFRGDLASVKLSKEHYAAFVELHIEQGPLLEQRSLPIGVVTAIAAPAAFSVTLEGVGGHAGAMLMPIRKDALCAAAEIILAVEAAAKGPDAVATVGVCNVHPGAINSVPSKVKLLIDVRDVQLAPRDASVQAIRDAIDEVSKRRGVTATVETLSVDPPATMAASVVTATEAACSQLKLRYQTMVSRAYHDSLFMAQVCPTGMIFIPCRDGVSHRPDEYSTPEAIRDGVAVLALTLAELSCSTANS
ncbi:Zn-dependent hydrolase [soil metagenome]